jgi:hypothetical protein
MPLPVAALATGRGTRPVALERFRCFSSSLLLEASDEFSDYRCLALPYFVTICFQNLKLAFDYLNIYTFFNCHFTVDLHGLYVTIIA